MSAYPPTIIIRDPHEIPSKCSILPLRGRPDLVFLNYPVSKPLMLDQYVRLSVEGPPLTPQDARGGLLLLDASWRRSTGMTSEYAFVPPRSLTGYRTAFPRVSKLGTDPQEGLASVEALYLAYHILGRNKDNLLDYYQWKDTFLKLNGLDSFEHSPQKDEPET